MKYDYCQVTEDHEEITEELCRDCTYKTCEHFPASVEQRKKEIEKFKSSEFASDILKRSSTLFGISEEEAEKHLQEAFGAMQKTADYAVRNIMKDAISSHITKYVDRKLDVMLDEIFKKAIESEMLILQKDETAFVTTIQKQATKKIAEIFTTKTSRNYNPSDATTLIEESIKQNVEQRVREAIKELKEETIERYSKATMKKMMEGMAKAIGEDKKLLSMMTG